MLICSECGKIIANTNPSVHYGICASCPIPHVDDGEPTTADKYNKEWLKEQKEDKKCCDECTYWNSYIYENLNNDREISLVVRSVSIRRIKLDPTMRIDARYWVHAKPKGE